MKNVSLSYSQFKSIVDAKGLLGQYVEGTDRYDLFAIEGQISWETSFLKDGGSDVTDFETNHKASYNMPMEYRSIDGLPKVASAKFADTKSFLTVGTDGVVSLTSGSTGYAKFHFTDTFTLSGVDASWYTANLGDYIDFEVGYYTDENTESTFVSLNKFGDQFKIYKDGNRIFDVPAVKEIPSTISGANIYIRAKCVNAGGTSSTVIINLIGWK